MHRIALAILGAALCTAISTGQSLAARSVPSARDLPATATCQASKLRIDERSRFSAVSGQRPISLRLTNIGSAPCTLRGYARPTLLDSRGRTLPFRVAFEGNGEVTARLPRTVRLAPGGNAFALVSMYRCDVDTFGVATQLRLNLPNGDLLQALPIQSEHLGFCGRGDPGSTAYVSPFEPTLIATTVFGAG